MSDQEQRQRVAVVVFADVSGGIRDGHNLVHRLLVEKLGDFDGTEHPVALGGLDDARTFQVRIHDVVEAGVAAGNGYLWTRPTSKAFRQYSWQFDGDEDPS